MASVRAAGMLVRGTAMRASEAMKMAGVDRFWVARCMRRSASGTRVRPAT